LRFKIVLKQAAFTLFFEGLIISFSREVTPLGSEKDKHPPVQKPEDLTNSTATNTHGFVEYLRPVLSRTERALCYSR
jgi:hypothetical protein